MIFPLIIIALLTLLSAYLSTRAYIRASFNKIDSLFFGSCFTLMFISTVGQIFHLTLVPLTYSFIIMIHFLESYVLLKFLSITIRLWQAEHKHSNRSIRITRAFLFTSTILVLATTVAITFSCNDPVPKTLRLELLARPYMDYYIEGLHALLSFLVFLFMPRVKFYFMLKIGALFFAISEVMQIVNLYLYNYGNADMSTIEHSIAMLGFISLSLGIIGMHVIMELNEERKNPRDDKEEATSLPFIKKIFRSGCE